MPDQLEKLKSALAGRYEVTKKIGQGGMATVYLTHDERHQREKQLGVETAVDITKAVAAALDYAHRHDVIHRDIKPGNVLLQDGQAQAADFGIALALSHAGGERLTETGLSLGTPYYMIPLPNHRRRARRSAAYKMAVMESTRHASVPVRRTTTIPTRRGLVVTQPFQLSAARRSGRATHQERSTATH